MSVRILPVIALAAATFLAACESSEEKAAAYYQSGLSLFEAGDLDRAAVEFRNVFRYDGDHKEARSKLAEILLAQGELKKAYSQYLRLAEQYPEDAGIRRDITAVALEAKQWDEAERHGRKAIELDPEPIETQAIRIALDYRKAVSDKDQAARFQLTEEARALLEKEPSNLAAHNVVIAETMDTKGPSAALVEIEKGLQADPDSFDYNTLKLRMLTALDAGQEIEEHLKKMFELFPENEDVQETLIAWYLSKENFEGAETFLRQLAGDDTASPDGHISVVRLIEAAEGVEAAQAELDRLIAANAPDSQNSYVYKGLKATYEFENGDRSQGIADLQALLEGAEQNDQTLRFQGILAKMLLATGNRVGARALTEEILKGDPANVVALKLRAGMLIEGDEPAKAIVDLRRALDQNPRDAETMLLLADAHARDGSIELQGERLAAAVEISESGVTESLRYADYLVGQGRPGAARSVLSDARAAHPGNVDILIQAAQLALTENSFGLVRGIIADLDRSVELDPRAADVAARLRSALLVKEDRIEDGLALLEEQAAEGSDASAVMAVVRTQLRTGKPEEARAYLDGLLAASPENTELRLIDAALLSSEGKPEEAEAVLRELVAQMPGAEVPAIQLYQMLQGQEREEEATAVLDTALAANPDALPLLRYQAARLEKEGDIAGAIAIHEQLYARNSNDTLTANNLASLLASFSDDPESLARATAVAKRLRGTRVPPFQDTYGWIAYRRGELEEALDYLEPAAAGLPEDALVQFHLGMAYAGLDRKEKAIETLERAIAMAGPQLDAQMATARETIDSLKAGKPVAAPAPAPAAEGTDAAQAPGAPAAEPGTVPADAPAAETEAENAPAPDVPAQ